MCVSLYLYVSCTFSLAVIPVWLLCHIPMCFFFYFIVIPEMPVCFLTRGKKNQDVGEKGKAEELGGIREVKIIFRIHCMKRNLLSIKEKNLQ